MTTPLTGRLAQTFAKIGRSRTYGTPRHLNDYMLKDIGITEGRPSDQALADKAEKELKRQYINRSMYATEAVTTVTPVAKQDKALR